MGFQYRILRKLWVLYLVLLLFAFFMFVLSINVYLESLPLNDLNKVGSLGGSLRRFKPTTGLVVGHYIAKGSIFGNISDVEYNANNFNPEPEEGKLGSPVIIPARDSFQMQRLFSIYQFNIMASDKIPLNRTLRDYRKRECQQIQYNVSNLPTTSVIIIFHNEAWSTLLRTVWSVIVQSPRPLLKEILLIDDASEREFLKKPLETYIKALPVPVRLLRHKQRLGLVAARNLGAKEATGDVLTFLDSHCECTVGWLEPQLARIKENKTRVVCPVIDLISDKHFAYMKYYEYTTGGFTWQFEFKWLRGYMNTNGSFIKPHPTPVMAGGLFSIDRQYFFDMGAYDNEMSIWGGENLEMSFRIWQCGGSIEIIPCSHVGHVFRSSNPSTFPKGVSETLGKNYGRAAMVWMDQWQDFVFLYGGVDYNLKSSIDVSERLELRKRLQCHSFDWFFKNVWPDHFFPADGRFFGNIISLNGTSKVIGRYEEKIRNLSAFQSSTSASGIFAELEKHTDLEKYLDVFTDRCLRSAGNSEEFKKAITKPLIIGNCVRDPTLQELFVMTPNGQIMTNMNNCIGYSNSKTAKYPQKTSVHLHVCQDDDSQHWYYNIKTQQIIHRISELCLTVNSKDRLQIIDAEQCQDWVHKQRWGLIPRRWRA